VEQYTYRYLREEPCGGLASCVVYEQFPVNKRSGYRRQIVWRDKAELRIWKVEYYDRKNKLLKTLTAKGFKKYLDRFWRADELTMVNHLTGKSTVLEKKEFRFRTGLRRNDFTRTGLKRAR